MGHYRSRSHYSLVADDIAADDSSVRTDHGTLTDSGLDVRLLVGSVGDTDVGEDY